MKRTQAGSNPRWAPCAPHHVRAGVHRGQQSNVRPTISREIVGNALGPPSSETTTFCGAVVEQSGRNPTKPRAEDEALESPSQAINRCHWLRLTTSENRW